MRVLIVGGTHFIGPHVVRALVKGGHEVTVFHRGETRADLPAAVRFIQGDRERWSEHARDLQRLEPDVVLDMIPESRRHGRELVQTFRGVARRSVAVSSLDVYRAYDKLRGLIAGESDHTPLAEDAPLRERLYPYQAPSGPADPDTEYEKILVEREVLGSSELPGTVLRLPRVYGPNDPLHRLWQYLKPMLDGREVIVLGKERAQFRGSRGYVENVARAIALAVTDERATGQIYNVGEPDALSEIEWVREIGGVLNWSGEVVTLPGERLPEHLRDTLNWSQDWTVDTRRLRRELGYMEEVTRAEALRRTLAWTRDHPPGEEYATIFDYAAEDAALKSAPLTP